jgi:hydrogenase maturation protease
MTLARPSLTIIGVGNEHRHDDGAGIAVARRLRERFPTGITVLEEGRDVASLIESWKDASRVWLVDAARSGARAGTIHRLDVLATPVPAGFFRCSTHRFGVAEAVELARLLDQLPAQLIVYGIEGENFDTGVGLSSAVEQAVETVVDQTAKEVRCLGAGGWRLRERKEPLAT